jgi:hypothetical protein
VDLARQGCQPNNMEERTRRGGEESLEAEPGLDTSIWPQLPKWLWQEKDMPGASECLPVCMTQKSHIQPWPLL